MKKFTVRRIERLIRKEKRKALFFGKYPLPHTFERYDIRNKIAPRCPDRTMIYNSIVRDINALEDMLAHAKRKRKRKRNEKQ